MSTFVLGPYFLSDKILPTNTTTNGGLTTAGLRRLPGIINRPGVTSNLYELGGPLGNSSATVLGASRLENKSLFTLINCYDTDHSTSPGRYKYLAGGPSGATILRIYKGTKPAISTLTNLSSYDSNLLVSFSIPAFSTTNAASSGMRFLQTNANQSSTPEINETTTYSGFSMILGICPIAVQATGTGVATWFWFGRNYSLTDLSDIAFVTGDVGGLGSGADLEVHNTTIESGEYYRSAGFKFEIPTIYTV